MEVLSFESDQPGSVGTPTSPPGIPPETPASEGNRLAHASPLPWSSPAQEVRQLLGLRVLLLMVEFLIPGPWQQPNLLQQCTCGRKVLSSDSQEAPGLA